MRMFLNGYVIFCFVLLAAGCESTPAKRSTFTNYEAPGNLESTHSLGCEKVSGLKNEYTPPDLYNGMVKCANENSYADAVYLFALAGVYSYYDGLRVADSSAHQAHSVLLGKSLDSLDKTRKDKLRQELLSTLGNKSKLPAVCSEMIRIGVPNYYPRYMVQHGMNAFLGSKSDDGLVKNFDSSDAWKKALSGYLHCPNL